MTAAVHLGASLDDSRQALPANPFTLMFGLADKSIAWPRSATVALIALGAVLLLVAVVGTVLYLRRQKGRTRVDRAASRMGRGRDIAPLGQRKATETAKRLGVESPGLPIRAHDRGQPSALRVLGGRLRRHQRPADRQDHRNRDPDAAGGARRRGRHVQQARHRRRDA